MPVSTLRVGPNEPATRLDVFLAARLDRLSRSAAQKLVRAGSVTVDGEVVTRPSHSVPAGSSVVVDVPDRDDSPPPVAVPQRFDIRLEDEHLLVVDKPAGLTVHPGAGHDRDTLVNGLLALRPEIASVGVAERPGIVHRLDRETSGLLVVAKTEAAYTALSQAIRDRTVAREYTALVRGRVEPVAGVVDAPLGRDPRSRRRQAVVTGGRAARTRYRVAEYFRATSLLDVALETGRTHQIRVHMASLGHPVCGDRTYGRAWPGPGGLERQFLHAHRLSFTHPVTGEPVEVTSALPDDLAASLAAARLE
ncbi:MAG: RluA family pseudouridine synthase [Dehalococcoidia bacterium]